MNYKIHEANDKIIELLNVYIYITLPVPVATRSKAWVCDRSPEEIVGWNPTGAWIFVCCECCVLSDRGLGDELITRPEESYRLRCVVLCDQENSLMWRPWSALGRSATENKQYALSYLLQFNGIFFQRPCPAFSKDMH